MSKPSAPAVFNLPETRNELPLDYTPGSGERETLDGELARIRAECPELALRIGGAEVRTGRLHPVLCPHDRHAPLAQAHWAGAAEVQSAIAAAAEASHDWSRMAWEDRAAGAAP